MTTLLGIGLVGIAPKGRAELATSTRRPFVSERLYLATNPNDARVLVTSIRFPDGEVLIGSLMPARLFAGFDAEALDTAGLRLDRPRLLLPDQRVVITLHSDDIATVTAHGAFIGHVETDAEARKRMKRSPK